MSSIAKTNLPILVIDDEKNYRIILSRILEGAGYQVLTADRPQVAMELILSDMCTTDIDGLELCRRVTRDIGSIPFILFSACIPSHYRQEIDATIDVWGSLQKPFDNQDVLSLVEDVLTTSALSLKSSHSQTINQ